MVDYVRRRRQNFLCFQSRIGICACQNALRIKDFPRNRLEFHIFCNKNATTKPEVSTFQNTELLEACLKNIPRTISRFGIFLDKKNPQKICW